MPTAPYDHPLNLTMQSVLTFGSWSITVLLFAIAISKDIRDGRAFYSLLVLAGLVGAYAEPLYDVGFMLWFYTPGQWTHFSAFSIPQPVWTHSGYVVLYSGTAMFICEQIRRGLTPIGLYRWAGITLLMSMAFEIIAINGGAYTYWGPHAFRILEYPLAIGVLEASQVICYSVAAVQLRERTTGNLPLLGLLLLFPCTFYLANFGAGSTLIIALHLDIPSQLLVQVASVASMVFALLLIKACTTLMAAVQTAPSSAECEGKAPLYPAS